MKKTEESQRPLGQYQMHQHSNYRGPRRSREKDRVWENFWRDYSWKFPQHGKGNSQSSPRGTKSPIRINPRRNMPKHILIELTKAKHKERILKAAKEKQQVTYKGNPIRLTADLSAEMLQAIGNGKVYLKCWKATIYNEDYFTWEGSHSKLMEK